MKMATLTKTTSTLAIKRYTLTVNVAEATNEGRELSKKRQFYIETEKGKRTTFARAQPRPASRAITFLANTEAGCSHKSLKVIRFERV
jgi:hypothetical protein